MQKLVNGKKFPEYFCTLFNYDLFAENEGNKFPALAAFGRNYVTCI